MSIVFRVDESSDLRIEEFQQDEPTTLMGVEFADWWYNNLASGFTQGFIDRMKSLAPWHFGEVYESAKLPPNGQCPIDGLPDSVEHNLLAANRDLMNALDLCRGTELGGMVLHALDELEGLSEKLNIDGFDHPDGR